MQRLLSVSQALDDRRLAPLAISRAGEFARHRPQVTPIRADPARWVFGLGFRRRRLIRASSGSSPASRQRPATLTTAPRAASGPAVADRVCPAASANAPKAAPGRARRASMSAASLRATPTGSTTPGGARRAAGVASPASCWRDLVRRNHDRPRRRPEKGKQDPLAIAAAHARVNRPYAFEGTADNPNVLALREPPR